MIDIEYTLIGRKRDRLDSLFRPKHVLVVGASDRPFSLSSYVVKNLLDSSANVKNRKLTLVSPRQDQVFGRPTCRSIVEVDGKPELALIMTGGKKTLEVMQDIIDITPSVKCIVLYGTDFDTLDPASGMRYIDLVYEKAKAANIRILGPNSSGVLDSQGLSALFGPPTSHQRGNLALLSNSGALINALLDWSEKEQFGFSFVASLGRMVDIGWDDMIRYLGSDPATRSIIMHMENLADVRNFISSAREVALTKPIIVLKSSHLGSHLTRKGGFFEEREPLDDNVVDEIFRRSGILSVSKIDELFLTARAIATQPVPNDKRLSIVTNASGPGVVAVDKLLEGGGQLAQLSPETRLFLDNVLPEGSSLSNPIDISWEANPHDHLFMKATRATLEDETSDATLVILTPQAFTEADQIAKDVASLAGFAKQHEKTLLASFMGGGSTAAAQNILKEAGIPNFAFADLGVQIFNYLFRYKQVLRNLYEVPEGRLSSKMTGWRDAKLRCAKIIETARKAGNRAIPTLDANKILETYGIPIMQSNVVFSEDEAVIAAAEIKFPIELSHYLPPAMAVPKPKPAETPNSGEAFAVTDEPLTSLSASVEEIAALDQNVKYFCKSVDELRAAFKEHMQPWIEKTNHALAVGSGSSGSAGGGIHMSGGSVSNGAVIQTTLSQTVGEMSELKVSSSGHVSIVGGGGGIITGDREKKGPGALIQRALDPRDMKPNAREGVFRVVLRSRVHSRVGPMLEFGSTDDSGVCEDMSLALPPLSIPLARQAMERTRVFNLICEMGSEVKSSSSTSSPDLLGVHRLGKHHHGDAPSAQHHFVPLINTQALESIVAQFSRMITDLPIRKSNLELRVSKNTIVVLNAEIEVVAKNEEMPRTAIRPYPTEYFSLYAGDSMGNPPTTFRIVRPEDEPLARAFYKRLSEAPDKPHRNVDPPIEVNEEQSRRKKDWVHDRIVNLCHSDYSTNLTLIAESRSRGSGSLEIVGMAHLVLGDPSHIDDEADRNFSILVLHQDRSPGLRIELLRRLINIAHFEKIRKLQTIIHPNNSLLLRCCKMVGFETSPTKGGMIRVWIETTKAESKKGMSF